MLNYNKDSLTNLISLINESCRFANSNFGDSNGINLSKSIQFVTSDEDFNSMLISYLNYLNNEFIVSANFIEISKCGLRARIKERNSIYIKLKHYKERELKKGSLSLNRCLNDLMGFRVIINGLLMNQDEVKSTLDYLHEQKIIWRWYLREDGLYKGYHCYFKVDNLSFPWELQLWDSDWEDNNIKDHKRHENEKYVSI